MLSGFTPKTEIKLWVGFAGLVDRFIVKRGPAAFDAEDERASLEKPLLGALVVQDGMTVILHPPNARSSTSKNSKIYLVSIISRTFRNSSIG